MLLLIHPIYYLLIFILLYFPACECCPSLSCLLPTDLFITWFLLTRLWVPPLICPICWLLTSFPLCLCSLACKFFLLAYPIRCLLTSLLLCLCSPGCECYLLFSSSLPTDLSLALFLFTSVWVLPFYSSCSLPANFSCFISACQLVGAPFFI